MIRGLGFGESQVFHFLLGVLVYLFLCVLGMRNNDGPKPHSGRTNGFIPTSFRAISGYLRIVSSGASTVASTVRSAASSIVDRDDDANHDQVQWAGFDKLECDGNINRQVLLLGYRSGFQVWDVEEADNVRDLVSRHDGPVSFLQMLPNPVASKGSKDKFADSRPLLVVCSDGSLSGGGNIQDGFGTPYKEGIPNSHDTVNGSAMPTVVRFYSLKSQSFVHFLKFRSVVYSVRCSSRVVAISQAAQIHCFDVATLEREYTILTNPIVTGSLSSGSIGYGPLAVGPRWLAYSGSPVVVSNYGRVSPQHLTTSGSFSGSASNGSLVAHYAKASSKQLAAGIVSLGDIGYKKLSRYCSELLPDSNNLPHSGSPGPGWKGNGAVNAHFPDADNVGMVIVRDIVTKSVITQFKAHKSPISALCFDPSGTLLVTASVQGHNINVFRIMPGVAGSSSGSDTCASYAHLYRLQRGFTNAVIQDISFSDDSNWIMISSSRGTSHLFAISPSGGSVNLQPSDSSPTAKNSGLGVPTKPAVRWPPNSGLQMLSQQNFCASGPPVTLSVVSRIRSGNNGWRGTVTGAAAAAAAATGRMSSLSGAIASSFHNCKANDLFSNSSSLKEKYHLLVFSPSGCVIQYALRISTGIDSTTVVSGLSTGYESTPDGDARLVVEAVQKWNVCQKQHRREREDNTDIYGENGNTDSSKIFPEGIKKENAFHPETRSGVSKSKISPEERHHLYISEAELQMHQAQNPLWAKPEIYFQTMMVDGLEENVLGGEIEVERFPTRMIEARSKDLVPVFDYLQTPKFQKARSSSGSLDLVADGGVAVAEHPTGIEETGWNGLRMPETDKGFVNSNDRPKTKTLETVNNRESFKMEAQHKFVNNNKDGLNVENQLEDADDEFD
ncbi:autophagy-related protein 18f isoform X3 [Vitis riparia]|uniref:autophagy-related protein 18f isoform X3 n=1 Tax=Vitis riparia TaxID=96939 RepID=UPI00155B3263|nr:autophagy-related protein 18f isoform X3 [Vitis riparia]